MLSAKLDNLLLLASLFEKRAYTFLKQAEDPATLPSPKQPPIALQAVSNLLGVSVSYEDVAAWADKNNSIFGNTRGANWRTANAGNDVYLRAFDRWDDNGDQEIYAFVGKTSRPPEGINISEAALLQGQGAIPTLWFYRGTKKAPNAAEQTSPELAHEDWLMTALANLFGRGRYGEFFKDVEKFVKESKSKIDKIRRHFEVSNPQVLGQGADGVAFAISQNLVLKIFRNQNAFNHAVMAMERLHKNPELAKTEAMIYDADQLGVFENQAVYYYIIEKMIPLSNMDQDVYSSLEHVIDTMRNSIFRDRSSHWRKFKEHMNNPEKHSELKEELKKGARNLVKECRDYNRNHIEKIENNLQDKLKSNWLESLAEELLVKYLTNRTDLHMGNIGFTGYGDFRFYDPVYNEHRSF